MKDIETNEISFSAPIPSIKSKISEYNCPTKLQELTTFVTVK